MNAELCKMISDSEIRATAFSLGPMKAPGGDGQNGAFFHNHQNIVGENICAIVKELFQMGNLPLDINETQVVLVPKVPNREEVAQFRPISCCKFVLKIITKIIMLHLRKIMDQLISPNQSAFSGGHLI